MRNTTWVARGESNPDTVNITDSKVDLQNAVIQADSWHADNTDVVINTESQLNIGSGNMNVIIKSNGKESDIRGREIIRIESGEMAIKAGTVDIRGKNTYWLIRTGNGSSRRRAAVKRETPLDHSTIIQRQTGFYR
ncbi:hypothetical protein AAIQ60_004496 [Salmonella enterica]